MNKMSLSIAAACLALAGLVQAAEQPAPMPQTRGMQGMDPKMHDPANKSTTTCTPKAGSETMMHDPKDHPMPDTRGMKGMDPAMHMEDCHSSDTSPEPKTGPHQHKEPGQG